MKKLIILLGLLVSAVGICNAQEKGFTYGIWTQAGVPFSTKGKPDFEAVELVVAPGYAFNHSLSLRAQFEASIGMWNGGGNGKTFRENGTLGLSVGYNVVKNKPRWGIVELTAAAGNTLYNKDWSYLYYDLGAGWAVPSGGKVRPLIGLGVRYYDSHNSRFESYFNFYAKIGFRFN